MQTERLFVHCDIVTAPPQDWVKVFALRKQSLECVVGNIEITCAQSSLYITDGAIISIQVGNTKELYTLKHHHLTHSGRKRNRLILQHTRVADATLLVFYYSDGDRMWDTNHDMLVVKCVGEDIASTFIPLQEGARLYSADALPKYRLTDAVFDAFTFHATKKTMDIYLQLINRVEINGPKQGKIIKKTIVKKFMLPMVKARGVKRPLELSDIVVPNKIIKLE